MTYEEFEWHILRLVYEEGVSRLQPTYLAYALGLRHEQVTQYLEQAAHSGLVEIDVGADGQLEYQVPGVDPTDRLPRPIWKADEEPEPTSETPTITAEFVDEEPPAPAAPPTDATPGPQPLFTTPTLPARHLAVAQHPQLPSSLRRQLEAQFRGPQEMIRLSDSPVVGTNATLEDPTSETMIALRQDERFPFRVEASDDTYCDPSQTVFMRQIRVHGVDSEEQLRLHVQRLFESFGYRLVQSESDRFRFERGSVTFILALVPLFVLVLPLFVYLFLYCMGRSTIHQEPVELDVQFRRKLEDGEPVYDIDLTFIGLHGVVLGSADQRVLNQEIDTLRDELRWSLSPG